MHTTLRRIHEGFNEKVFRLLRTITNKGKILMSEEVFTALGMMMKEYGAISVPFLMRKLKIDCNAAERLVKQYKKVSNAT
jgi:hypothetical protein